MDEVREFWNDVADDWRIQVGDDGDFNRRLNSDPVLWRFAGEVNGLTVLDAGCGTGYLSSGEDPEIVVYCKTRPYSVAFRLRKMNRAAV